MTFYTWPYWGFCRNEHFLFTMHILHVLYAKLTKFSEKTHDFQVLFFIQWQKKYRIRFLSVHTKRFHLTKTISVKRKKKWAIYWFRFKFNWSYIYIR